MDYVTSTKLNDDSFIQYFENRVQETINEFNLFSKSEPLLVAASGGKDSTVLLCVLKNLGYKVEAITINAHIGCYSDASLENLKKFCTKENISLREISLEKESGYKLCHIMALMEERGLNKTSCSICGTLRRYLLNKYGKEMNANILLTGHNLDDEAEGILMALCSGNTKQVARLGPLSMNNSDAFVKRAKPLYFMFEDEIERYSKVKNFEVHYGWCPCSVKASRRFYAELGVSHERKFNVAKNIIGNTLKLKEHFKSIGGIKTCPLCEQPASNDICQTCSIIETLKDPALKKVNVSHLIQKYEQEHNTCEVPLIQIK
ncbi:MAG TPA: ATP-binding protein [Candidatus Nanoarchaeia archaeon]|nr:ATP-binding protein [Candidatus Nanoarchaeia archaeon]